MSESAKTVASVYATANRLAGLTVKQVARQVGFTQPENLVQEKGWVGQLIEAALGAESGSLAQPDFPSIGLELKTIPIDSSGKALESTYVSVVPLLDVRGARWHDSVVWQKLSRVLWVPLLAEKQIPLAERVFATPVLWSPSSAEQKLLRADWEAVMEKVSLGQIDTINARHGSVLQVRPKAANSRVVTDAIGPDGNTIKTLPRGFYLRAHFTSEILAQFYTG